MYKVKVAAYPGSSWVRISSPSYDSVPINEPSALQRLVTPTLDI